MGQQRARVDVPATPTGPRVARRLIAVLLEGWQLPGAVADAQLIVSELVANAVRHAPAADTVELELTATPEQVRISLADGSSITPIVAELDHAAPSGRGMRIVAALASNWGAEIHDGGKRVWVTIPTT